MHLLQDFTYLEAPSIYAHQCLDVFYRLILVVNDAVSKRSFL